MIISDGEAVVSDTHAREWRSFQARTSARLLYVPVAAGYGSIEHVADKVIPVSEIDAGSGQAIAGNVARWMR